MKRKFTKLIAALALLVFMTPSLAGWGQTTSQQQLTNADIVAAGNAANGYASYSIEDGSGNIWNAYAIKNKHSNATSAYHFLQIRKNDNNGPYYIQVPELGTKITSITMTVSNTSQPMTGGGNSATLYFSNSNSTSSTGTGVASGSGDSSVTIDCSTLNLNTGYITAGGAVRIWDVSVTYTTGGTPSPSMSVSTNSIDFGNENTINPSEPYTETFEVTFANLTENLTVTGFTGISVSPATINYDATSPQTVTISYNPTEVGSISGNISVNSSEVTEALVAVTGSAYDPANIDTYERYTGAIIEGDYVIYNTNGAMKSEISSNRFANQSVTISGTTITNPDASTVWHIAPNGNYWTIYNASVDKYAGGTTSKNQGALLDDATDNHALWTITYQYSNFTIENYGRSQDSNDPNNKFLRQNGTSGWATYGSGTGSVPQLYKKVITNQVATPTFSVAAGTYYEAKSVELNCETTGATIYYTTDGTTPSASNGTEYTTAISVSTTTTIKAIAVNDGMNDSDIATATYIIEQPYSTMDEIFAAATTAGSTAASHMVEFGSWFVTGVSTSGKNVYVTDGTKGFVIRDDDGGLASTYHADDLIEGTVWASLKLNQGYAQLTDVDASGLTIEEYGAPDFAEISMANLSGINTGALVQYVGLTCSVSSGNYYLSNGTTTLQVYNSLYADVYDNFEAGKTYTISGVYQQYGDTKEILPRSADDIVEVLIPSITVTPATANPSANDVEGTLAIAYENLTINNMNDFAVQFYDENNQELNGANVPGWIEVLVAEAEGGTGYVVSYTMGVNEGEARSAYFKVFALGDEDYVYSNLVTVIQAAYVATTTYTLVTSQSDLMPGKHYIIVGSNTAGTEFYAMGEQTTAGSSKIRSAVAVTKNENQVIGTEDVCEFVISGDATHGWTFYDITSNMYLKAVNGNEIDQSATLLAEYCYWTIDFNVENAVELIQSIKYTDRYINFNYTYSRFANYKTSGNQRPVSIYVKVDDTDIELHSPTTLSSTNTITVPENGTLTVKTNGSLTNTDAANLTLESGAQLFSSDANVQATVKKEIGAFASNGWKIIASPISGSISFPSNLVTDGKIYKYDEPTHYWRYYNSSTQAYQFSTLVNQTGYLYGNDNTVILSFAGELLPTGSQVEKSDLSYTSDNEEIGLDGWNLVGNPFPCNAYTNKAYYVAEYDAEAGENVMTKFTVKTLSDPIAPCTGILVKATSDKTVKFNTTQYSDEAINNGNILMTVAQQVVNRGVSSSVTRDNAIVSFNEGNLLEKFVFNENNAKLYISQNGKDYAIAVSEGQGTMPVNFRANEDGNYTLTVNPEGVEMNYLHLIDNVTGNDIDLLMTPSYSFNATTNDYESRFRLVFAAANNEDGASTGSAAFAFMSDGNWIINNAGEATLQVIDLNGRILSSERVNGSVSKTINATSGVYMLRLINGENVMVQKIVVR